MKFLTNHNTVNTQPYSIPNIETYIYNTKDDLALQLPKLFEIKHQNITHKESKSLKILNKTNQITIKPADKNLGVVIMDTTDYLEQCLIHLSSETYQLLNSIPDSLHKDLENTVIKFKQEITRYNKLLYNYLLPHEKHRTPRFYGLPKIHKLSSKNRIPPLRPIVSHTKSLLSHSAKFLDHTLQPLARSYPDYIQNSTELILKLSTLLITEDITLVSMDIISLFPSIPQKECLQITYEEMCNHQDLLIFSPNLLIHLLQYNMQNNYFEFADFCFLQKTGVTMGAAFSPTVDNIFVSVFLRKFLNTINEQPILIARYVDDIFLIWPKKFNIDIFTSKINKFHPNITTITSDTSIDFLDITIFKGNLYTKHQLLDIKTFQKPHNLYQYLNFSSNHTKSTFKSLITGECVRYVRTNTDEQNYLNQISLFKLRLQRRSYPTKFINNNTKKTNTVTETSFFEKTPNINLLSLNPSSNVYHPLNIPISNKSS